VTYWRSVTTAGPSRCAIFDSDGSDQTGAAGAPGTVLCSSPVGHQATVAGWDSIDMTGSNCPAMDANHDYFIVISATVNGQIARNNQTVPPSGYLNTHGTAGYSNWVPANVTLTDPIASHIEMTTPPGIHWSASQFVDQPEIAAPAAPATGIQRIWADSASNTLNTSGGNGGTCNSPGPVPDPASWAMVCDNTHNLDVTTGMRVNGQIIATQFTVDPNPLTAAMGRMPRHPHPAGLDHSSAMRVLSPNSQHWLDIDVPDTGDPHFVSSTGHVDIEGGITIGGAGGDFRGVLLEHMGTVTAAIFGNLYTRHTFIGPDPNNTVFPGYVDAPENTRGGTVGFGSSFMGGHGDHLKTGDVAIQSGDNESHNEEEQTGSVDIRPGLVRSPEVTHPMNGGLTVAVAGYVTAAETIGTLACVHGSAFSPLTGPLYGRCTTAEVQAGKWVGAFREYTVLPGVSGYGHSVSVAAIGQTFFASTSSQQWHAGEAICSSTTAGYLVESDTCAAPAVMVGIVTYTDTMATITHNGVILSHR
jgi:hypothetical protein